MLRSALFKRCSSEKEAKSFAGPPVCRGIYVRGGGRLNVGLEGDECADKFGGIDEL